MNTTSGWEKLMWSFLGLVSTLASPGEERERERQKQRRGRTTCENTNKQHRTKQETRSGRESGRHAHRHVACVTHRAESSTHSAQHTTNTSTYLYQYQHHTYFHKGTSIDASTCSFPFEPQENREELCLLFSKQHEAG